MNALIRLGSCGLLLAALATGCSAANHSHVEDHWGESYRTLKAQQIANPNAGQDPKPVEGMNSTTARDVTATYHSRQAEQPVTRENTTLLDLVGGN